LGPVDVGTIFKYNLQRIDALHRETVFTILF